MLPLKNLLLLLLPLLLLPAAAAGHQVTHSECAPDEAFIVDERHLDSEEQCVQLCNAFTSVGLDCTFAAWSPVDTANCRLYNEKFSDYIGRCDLLGGPRDLSTSGCNVTDPADGSCDVFRMDSSTSATPTPRHPDTPKPRHPDISQESQDFLKAMFKFFNRDDSGRITATETQQALHRLGFTMTDAKVEKTVGMTDLDGDGKISFQEFESLMKEIGFGTDKMEKESALEYARPPGGVSDLWRRADHVAVVVSDVAASSAFYGNILGLKQIHRPDFDRYGAWFTLGNVDLHLIKGRPAVHDPDDLIVGHIALNVGSVERIKELMARLDMLGVPYRENISVPNSHVHLLKEKELNNGKVKQAFVTDPDGHYIEFCSCEHWEEEKVEREEEEEAISHGLAEDMRKLSGQWILRAGDMKQSLTSRSRLSTTALKNSTRALTEREKVEADPTKLQNLLERRNIYGDITQSASPEQLEQILIFFNNDIRSVVAGLLEAASLGEGQVFIPPAFYERDTAHTLVQPPSFKIRPATN